MQHVVLRATWYEGITQLLSLTQFKSHFFFSFISLAEPLTDEGEEVIRVPRKKKKKKHPDDYLQAANIRVENSLMPRRSITQQQNNGGFFFVLLPLAAGWIQPIRDEAAGCQRVDM